MIRASPCYSETFLSLGGSSVGHGAEEVLWDMEQVLEEHLLLTTRAENRKQFS